MKRQCTIFPVIIACVVLLAGNNMTVAQDDSQPKPSESAEQPSPVPEIQKNPDDISEGSEGYHPEGRRIGTSVNVERDLDFSFPKRD